MLVTKFFVPSVRSLHPRYIATKSGENAVIITKKVNNNGLMLLNRQKSLNSADVELNVAFANILNDWKDTKSLIIVRGNGEKAFCSGGDLVSVAQNNSSYAFKWAKTIYTALYQVSSLQTSTYVALMNGIAVGTGLGIAAHGKYRVATEKTVCAMPETLVGLFPDVGSSYFLPRLQGNLGYYMGLTALYLHGKDVYHSGIATHYCDSSKIPELQKTLLNLENANDVEAVLNEFCPKPQTELSFAKHIDQINECFNADSVEEILSKLEKDGSVWAKQTIKTLRKMSPKSVKVAFRHLKWGANRSLGECLQMDYRLIHNFYFYSDFNEGVRALLIEKDNKPKWNPSRLEDLSPEQVATFFAPAPNHQLDIDVQLPDADYVEERMLL